MLEHDISALSARETVDLDKLEADIWRRVHQRAERRATGRFMISWQGLVLLLSVTLSAATGLSAASRVPRPVAPLVENGLAPSALLLGSQR